MIKTVREMHDISKAGVLKYSFHIPKVVIVTTMIINNLTGTTYTCNEIFKLVTRTCRSRLTDKHGGSITLNLDVDWGGKS